MTKELPSKMLNVEEVAQICGVAVSTLNKFRLTGGGPMYAKIGKRCLYDPEDVRKWLDLQKRKSTSAAR